MTTVEIPPKLPEVSEPDACTAADSSGGPSAMAATLRATAVAVSDVVTAVRGSGMPGDWEGAAADSAGVAFAAFRSDADGATAALEVVVRGVEVYDHQVRQAARRWQRLDDDRRTLNRDIDDLRARVDAAASGDGRVAPDVVAGFVGEAERLTRRRDAVVGDFETLDRDVEAVEDRLIRVFTSVDSVEEGQDAADAPSRGRVDDLVRHLLDIRDDPDAVNRWWLSLSPAVQNLLLIRAPGLLGGTGGLPVRTRDTANRAQLERDLEHLHGLQENGIDLTDEQERLLENAEQTQAALDDGATAPPDPRDGALDVNLLLYEPGAFDGDGAGAIAYGNPDTADNTAVLVPGLGSDLSSLRGLGEDAQNLLDELAGSGETNAVIGWIGYDAPNFDAGDVGDLLGEGGDVAGVIGEDQAEAGGHQLVDFVDGLRGSDRGDESNLTVIGHSYGSTTAAHAGADGLDEDALVLLGSPGAGGGVDDASDLGAPHLYIGSRDNDPVTWLGRDGALGLGPDPVQADFGGTRFDAGTGADFDWNEIGSIGFEANHNGYYDDGSASLGNLGAIVRGGGPDTVVPGRDQPANDYLGDWLGDQVRETFTDPLHEHVLSPLGDAVDGARDTAGGLVDDTLDSLVTFGTRGVPVGVG